MWIDDVLQDAVNTQFINTSYFISTMNHWKSALAVIGTGQLISLLTSSIVGFSIIFWISIEFKSPSALALAILAGYLPQFVLGLFAGVYVDRWNRKRTMIFSDLFIAVCTLCLFALIANGHKDLPYFYLLSACRSVGNTFHAPALQASIPLLVPQKQLVRISGMYRSIQALSEIIAPVTGAALIAFISIEYVLLIDAAGAAVACLTLLFVHIPSPKRQNRFPNFKNELKECWQSIHHTMGITALFLCFTLVNFILVPLFTLFPFMTLSHFQGDTFQMGIVEMGWGAGSLSGGIILAVRQWKVRQTLLLHSAYVVLGGSLVCSGLLPEDMFAGFVCLTFIGGIAYAIYYAIFTAIIQQNVASDILGRTFSLMFSLSTFPSLLGILASGYLVELWNISTLFVMSGTAIGTIGIIACFIRSLKPL